jgi:hypothetical protein
MGYDRKMKDRKMGQKLGRGLLTRRLSNGTDWPVFIFLSLIFLSSFPPLATPQLGGSLDLPIPVRASSYAA